MYCSSCGAKIPEGYAGCVACGAAALRAPEPWAGGMALLASGGAVQRRTVRVCPRCSFQGQSVPYFSRGAHIAAMVALVMLTGMVMGMGGLIYFMIKRNERICPKCGEGWGEEDSRSLELQTHAGSHVVEPALVVPGARRERASQMGSFMMAALAAILMIIGVANAEFAPFLIGAFSGAGGLALHMRARVEREARRDAIIAGLQLPVLKLAAERQGRLTVTDVAATMGWTLPRAEKVLNSLDDGVRVSSDVTDEGVIVYDFRELRQSPLRARLDA